MIPLETEIQIHKMLLAKTPKREIASRLGVSDSTVARIARALILAGEVDDKTCVRARIFLTDGLSPQAVSARLGISLSAAFAIQRSSLLMASVVESPRPCPTCGATMLPTNTPKEHAMTEPPRTISAEHARRLFSLADEIVGLAKAYTVRNMLFYGIADNMEALLTTITMENEQDEENHR